MQKVKLELEINLPDGCALGELPTPSAEMDISQEGTFITILVEDIPLITKWRPAVITDISGELEARFRNHASSPWVYGKLFGCRFGVQRDLTFYDGSNTYRWYKICEVLDD